MFKKYVPGKSLSWADMEDDNEINSSQDKLSFSYIDSASTSTTSTNRVIGTPVKEVVSSNRRWETISRKRKRKNKCFICNKQRKHINEHFIAEKNNVVFYHDMCGRPMILAFPLRHITNFKDNDSTFIGNMIRTIEQFCIELDLDEYSFVYDFKRSEHLKIKIKVNEGKIKDIRDHHFKIKQIEKVQNKKSNAATNTKKKA